jgi:hypothetical protein
MRPALTIAAFLAGLWAGGELDRAEVPRVPERELWAALGQ